jgi:ribonuclease HI
VEMTTPVVIHFDGGARPPDNGSAAIGYTIEIDGSTEEKEHDRIGKATCNEAEYCALIRGLEVASEKGYTDVEARGDSQLVVKQVTDDWDTNKQHLRELRDRVRELTEEFETFEIQHIPREENLRADELVDRELGD